MRGGHRRKGANASRAEHHSLQGPRAGWCRIATTLPPIGRRRRSSGQEKTRRLREGRPPSAFGARGRVSTASAFVVMSAGLQVTGGHRHPTLLRWLMPGGTPLASETWAMTFSAGVERGRGHPSPFRRGGASYLDVPSWNRSIFPSVEIRRPPPPRRAASEERLLRVLVATTRARPLPPPPNGPPGGLPFHRRPPPGPGPRQP